MQSNKNFYLNCETIHNALGQMIQTFNNGCKLVCTMAKAEVIVYDRNDIAIMLFRNVTLKSFAEIQQEVQNY